MLTSIHPSIQVYVDPSSAVVSQGITIFEGLGEKDTSSLPGPLSPRLFLGVFNNLSP